MPSNAPVPAGPVAEGWVRQAVEQAHQARAQVGAEEPASVPRALMSLDAERVVLSALSPLCALLLWEVAARQAWVNPLFFPPPSAVLAAFAPLLAAGELQAAVRASLVRLVAGLASGGGLGLAMGLAMAVLPRLRKVVEPLVALTYPLPKIALLPLLLVLFGIGEPAKILVLAIGAFFLVLFATLQGVDDVLMRHGVTLRALRLRGWDYYGRALLQGALPSILVGLRTAAGYCLVLLVAAEFAGEKDGSGLGYLIWHSWELFFVESMYVGLVSLAVLGSSLFALLTWLIRRLPNGRA